MIVKSNISEKYNNEKHIKDTDHYKKQYANNFVNKWDELIDWKLRVKGEGDFFIEQLKKIKAKRVLDVATGTGFHSIRLLEEGFEVTSADGSTEMLSKAFENGRKRGLILSTVQADWRYLNRHVHGEFDAVICLGNSFTHLFDEGDRRKALAEFYAALKHDGVLIIDQRNYDSILDNGFSSKHSYYYCGKNVSAEPEYVDENLARFKYEFSDNSKYYLNMFPLRKAYTRRLLKEVGFQTIETFGDFQSDFSDNDPDFYVHVAEKKYIKAEKKAYPSECPSKKAITVTKDYYNSKNADNFYSMVWGGEDIHVGIYENDNEPIKDASLRSKKHLAGLLKSANKNSKILDIGSGYGGGSRFLAQNFGSKVSALNLSDVENERHRAINKELGLSDLIDVVDGSFENLKYEDETFDIVWSQDALLHSPNKEKVFSEVARVLKNKGEFVFTDPMQNDNCPDGVLQPILDRIHLKSLSCPCFYKSLAAKSGFNELTFEDLTKHLITHYSRVLDETKTQRNRLEKDIDADYLDKMEKGLKHWVDGGKNDHLVWGCFHFTKNIT